MLTQLERPTGRAVSTVPNNVSFAYFCANWIKVRNPVSGQYDPLTLFPYQQEFISDVRERFKAAREANTRLDLTVVKARQIGVTTVMCAYLLYRGLLVDNDGYFIYCSQTIKAVDDGSIDCVFGRMVGMLRHMPSNLGIRFRHVRGQIDMWWGKQRHATVMAQAYKSSGRGRTPTFAVLDEFAFAEDQEAVLNATNPFNRIVISTFNQVGDHYYRRWKDSPPENVLGPYTWEQDTRRTTEQAQLYYADFCRNNGELAARRDLACDPDSQSEDALFTKEMCVFRDAKYSDVPVLKMQIRKPGNPVPTLVNGYQAIWGYDPAGFDNKGDGSALVRRVGRYITHIRRWRQSSLNQAQIAQEAVRFIRETDIAISKIQIIVDCSGGYGDTFRTIADQEGLSQQVVIFKGGESSYDKNCHNKRATGYYNLLTAMAEGIYVCTDTTPNISPEVRTELTKELMAQRRKPNARGQFQLVDKSDIRKRIGKSPDLADALSMTFTR